MTATVYVDSISGLDPLLTRLAGHKLVANRIMINILRDLSMFIKVAAMKELVQHKNVRTRLTLQSITVVVDQARMIATIGTHNIIGLFLEKGTSPHPIVARNAPVLMLPVSTKGTFSPFRRDMGRGGHYRATGSVRAGAAGAGAQVAFFKSVHHPGNKPMPFLYPAFQSSTPFREALLKLAGEEITKYLAGI